MRTKKISRLYVISFLALVILGRFAWGAEVRTSEPIKIVDRYARGMLLDANGQRVLLVAGSPYEMGYQQGKLLGRECRGLIEKLLFFTRAAEASRRDSNQ